MEYGLIGEHLPHSFSKEIHGRCADYDYQLTELTPEQVSEFMTAKEFKAINVTIPYKQTVIPFLSYLDESATSIGAVNTVVNRDGELYGYNTDFYGMEALIRRMGISLTGKKVLILGTGGTSRTAQGVAKSAKAGQVVVVGRSPDPSRVTYGEMYEAHTDGQIIINTTPCGMFPFAGVSPIDIDAFPRLEAVADAIYNPLCSELVLSAKARGLKAAGGLYMLVMQAVKAVEFFLGESPDTEKAEAVYQRLLQEKQNIVLIGMPSCGKSSVSAALQRLLGRETVDTDTLITEKAGKSIPEIFEESGERGFRDIESAVIKELSSKQGLVIATGGGVILREENLRALRANGVLVFLDRPLSELLPTEDRPLSSDRTAMERRYHERFDKYVAAADLHIPATTALGVEGTARLVIKEWTK